MKFLKKLPLTAAALLFASATIAQTATPATTTTTTPAPTPVLQFSVGGQATFNGFGVALFQGSEGYSIAEKSGGATTKTELTATGKMCGANCESGTFKFTGMAFENVTAGAGAKSLKSGDNTAVVNSGGSFTNVNFAIGKVVTAPAQPAP